MNTYCGANCENCPSKENCKGCRETCGSPFGGCCVAAEYIKFDGLEAYQQFKQKLLDEINVLLGPMGSTRSTVSSSWSVNTSIWNIRCPAGRK